MCFMASRHPCGSMSLRSSRIDPIQPGFYYGDAEQTTDNRHLCTTLRLGGGSGFFGGSRSRRQWRVKVKCRNRFYEGDELAGILSPHKPIRTIKVQGLAEVYDDGAESALPKWHARPWHLMRLPLLLNWNRKQHTCRLRRKDPTEEELIGSTRDV